MRTNVSFFEQRWVSVKGISSMKFIPYKKALWRNYTESLAFCASMLPKIDFDVCASSTSDPDVLNLENCEIMDREGRSLCNEDGIRKES